MVWRNMRYGVAALSGIVLAKTAMLHWHTIHTVDAMTGGIAYLGIVGGMLIAMSIDWLMIAGYAAFVRPRRPWLICGLLIGLTITEYVIAEGVIYAFGITP